jgi:sugar lactone lactonase YvrE
MSDNLCEQCCNRNSSNGARLKQFLRNCFETKGKASSRRSLPPIFLAIAICAALAAFPCMAATQNSFIFPVQAVGAAAQVLPVPVTIQAGGIIGAIRVLTQGVPSLDFTDSMAGTCTVGATYLPGICTVNVSFNPKYPGLRSGAVLLLDKSGLVMATQILSGVGVGSLSVMLPGEIHTLAGDGFLSGDGATATSSAINLPLGEATDAAGNLYFSDSGNNRLRKVDSAGNITTIAGTGIAGSLGDGGLAINAQINNPAAIVVDGAGNIFFADSDNNAIREINISSGAISTIAGTLGEGGYSGDGSAATAALLASPKGFAFDANNNLYIADTGNSVIRKVNGLNGTIGTSAGNGVAGFAGDGGLATSGQFKAPWGIAIALDGSLYIADFFNNRIRKIDPTGMLSTVAGNGNANYTGDGSLATAATLNSPASVAVDAAGNLYIADSENNCIRKVNINGKITTLAGNGSVVFSGDGFDANLAGLYKPYSVYLDGAANLFIADRLDLRIREVSATTAGIHYPIMKEGKVSLPIAQSLENDGNVQLTLSNLTASPTTNSGLDTLATDPVTTTCSTTQALQPGISCILAVEFVPVAVGSPAVGVLTVTSDSSNNPVTVDLSGTVLSVDPTTTAVTSNLNPSALGAAVTFTAHITSPNKVTGTVQFLDGTTNLGTPQTINSSGNGAYLTTSFSVLGVHNISAVYSGDNANSASTSLLLQQTVEQTTTLSLTSSSVPATVFAPITFTATVMGWTTTPTGNITFEDGATVLGSSPLSANAVATYSTALLAAGNHNIIAAFAGDTVNFASSISIVQSVNSASTTTSLSTSNPSVPFGTAVTFTATVLGVSVSTPTGSVVFKDGSIVLATAALNSSGAAIYVNTTLTAGPHSITATYQGDSDYAVSMSTPSVTETIVQTATATALSASTAASIVRNPVNFTAIVTSSIGRIPTGTVTFVSSNILVCSGTLDSTGKVSCATTSLAVGLDNVTATYAGDPNDTASTSSSLLVAVQQAPTTTILSSSQNPLLTLAPVIIAAKVANGSTNSATGQVTFTQDSTVIGVVALDATGAASVSISSLTVGAHTFLAVYAGDGLDIASSAPPLIQTVQLRPTTDVLTTSATSISGGEQVTLIAIIHSTGPVAPTGTVSFKSGGLLRGVAALDGAGLATLTILPMQGDPTIVVASYAGDAVYSGSDSSGEAITVGQPDQFSMQLSQSSVQMQSGQNIGIDLAISSLNQFTDTLSLGCLGLPMAATCTYTKDIVNLPSGATETVHLVFDTGLPLVSGSVARNASGATSSMLVCFLPGGIFLGMLGWLTRRRRSSFGLLMLLLYAGSLMGITGCGGLTQTTTPAGTYLVRVTASGAGSGVTQSIDLTVVVK